jgi:hypothetical protein
MFSVKQARAADWTDLGVREAALIQRWPPETIRGVC